MSITEDLYRDFSTQATRVERYNLLPNDSDRTVLNALLERPERFPESALMWLRRFRSHANNSPLTERQHEVIKSIVADADKKELKEKSLKGAARAATTSSSPK